jgi:ABC-type transport system substrate-binding protein
MFVNLLCLISSRFRPANEFWHNPDVGHFTFDKEQARSTLREAGYDWDDDGRLLMPAGNGE